MFTALLLACTAQARIAPAAISRKLTPRPMLFASLDLGVSPPGPPRAADPAGEERHQPEECEDRRGDEQPVDRETDAEGGDRQDRKNDEQDHPRLLSIASGLFTSRKRCRAVHGYGYSFATCKKT